MQLDPAERETLEYLQRMLRTLRLTAQSKSFSQIVYLIDVTLLQAAEFSAGQCLPDGSRSVSKAEAGCATAPKHRRCDCSVSSDTFKEETVSEYPSRHVTLH